MINNNEQYSVKRLTATGVVKAGQGVLGGFIVASGSPTIALYDGADATGTLILNTMQTAATTSYPFPYASTSGIYAVITGTADITFFIN
jgi:hypothetical protein